MKTIVARRTVENDFFKRLKTWYVAVIIVSLSGCVVPGKSGIDKTGQELNDLYVKSIIRGKTTRDDVIKMFGQPPILNSAGGGNETWAYNYLEIKKSQNTMTYVPVLGFFGGEANAISNSKALTIQFTGCVVSTCIYTKSSMNVMSEHPTDNHQKTVSTPCDEIQ